MLEHLGDNDPISCLGVKADQGNNLEKITCKISGLKQRRKKNKNIRTYPFTPDKSFNTSMEFQRSTRIPHGANESPDEAGEAAQVTSQNSSGPPAAECLHETAKREEENLPTEGASTSRDWNAIHNGALFSQIPADEVSQIKTIARVHDMNYKSINFGEHLIKELVMSSMTGTPMSPGSAMSAYQLMNRRVTKVAQGFDSFIDLPTSIQGKLLKRNSDYVISLRSAVFFEKTKGGLDQLLITMGVDDLKAAMNVIVRMTTLKHIDYQVFNSLQKVEKSSIEERHSFLLQRIGSYVCCDADIVKLLSYILLFSPDIEDADPEGLKEVERIQSQLLGMMKRYINAKFPNVASKLFSGLMGCISDLKEISDIKRHRQLADHRNS